MPQPPQTGSLEQVLRCLALLAVSPAYTTELSILVSYMGAGAFKPAPFKDANGGTFALSVNDTQFGDPASWMPTAFKAALITQQLHTAGPFPTMQLLASAGRALPATGGVLEADTGEFISWVHTIDAVTIASNDRPEFASRTAVVMSNAFEHLVRRNQNLGGLVQLITSDGPPAPGGDIESAGVGIISGVLQRYQVVTLNTIV